MSTISQTPKINTVRTPSLRNSNLLVIAAIAIALIVVIANAVASRALKPVDNSAYMLYRQGEWLSVPIMVSNAEAYQIFRQVEVASPLTYDQAYQLFRKGEITSPAVLTDAEAFHVYRLGEWAYVNLPTSETLDLTAYYLSERTFSDPQAGMNAYLASERTSIPARFNPYQQSEWFGK